MSIKNNNKNEISKKIINKNSSSEENFIVQSNDLNNYDISTDVTNNSEINIVNSNEVTIGQVTHFNGPVTIYQNYDDNNIQNNNSTVKFNNSKILHKNSGVKLNNNEKKSKINKLFYSPYCLYGCPLVFLCILIPLMFLIININKNKSNPDNNNKKIETLGNHSLIDRSIWGGRSSKNFTKSLKHPTNLVIISHTATEFCTEISECSSYVRTIQEYHVSKINSPDIGYNFLIGGDANIYIGRDWDIRNFHRDNSIGISFIGNYIYDELTSDMLDAIKVLLNEGVRLHKLDNNYKVICHNQTFNTESPGPNIYKIVKTWSNFVEGKFYIYSPVFS